MNLPPLLVTGDHKFIQRYAPLLEALSRYYLVKPCPIPDSVRWTPKGFLTRLMAKLADRRLEDKGLRYQRLQKSRYAFLVRSRSAERLIRRQAPKPDLVLHLYGMFAPFGGEPWIPYAMWLDYTMSLAHRNYPPWAPFRSDQDRYDWLACERQAYGRAHHIFATSEVVRRSVIDDYGVPASRVTVVGGGGGFRELYQGKRTFGSGRCLFNGSDFLRKGGDLLLQAWPMVREKLPKARLAMVGAATSAVMDGLENLGYIGSREQMKELFLASDLVVAPARCDPYPTFLLEALSFGLPCVASDRDAMPEIVADGVTGKVVKNLEPAAIAAAVIDLLSDPERLARLGEQAREAARLRFNWDTVALRMTEALRKTLKRLKPTDTEGS